MMPTDPAPATTVTPTDNTPQSNNTLTVPDAIPETPTTSTESLRCFWAVASGVLCNKQFADPAALYSHLTDDHVGRKSTGNLCLSCKVVGCPQAATIFAKRDHITSHLRSHVPLKANVCETCGRTFKWLHDLRKHGFKTGHPCGQLTAHEHEDTSSEGTRGSLPRPRLSRRRSKLSRGRSASDASTSLEVLVDLTAEDNGDTVRAIGGAASPMPIFPHDGAFSDLLTVQSPPEYGRPPFSPLPVARYPSFDSTTSLSYSEGVRSDWTEDAASHTGSFLETPPFTQSFDALGPPSPATGPLSPGMFPSYVADNTLMLNRFLAEMPHSLSLQTPPYEYDQTVVFRNSPMSPPLSDIFPLESPAIPVDGGTPGLSGYPPWSDPAPPPNAPPVPSIAISLYSPAETEQSDLISDFLDNPPPDFSALSESHPNSLGGLQVPDLTGMRSYDSYSDVSSCADASEIIEAMSAVGDSDYLEVGVQHVSSGLEVKSPLAGFDVRLNSVSLEGLDVGHHPTLGVQHQPGLRVPTGIGVHPTLEIHPGTTTLEELAASLQLDAPA